MADTKIQLFLDSHLPEIYSNPPKESGESPVADLDELIMLYTNKYATFGTMEVFIYDEVDDQAFVEAMNALFAAGGKTTQVDPQLLRANIHQLTPMIVVDGEIISKGVYPELISLRGGSDSISRGGSGGHHHH